MQKNLFIVIKILLILTIFSACSGRNGGLSMPEKVYVSVLFTPESFCEIGYNDITLKAIESYSSKYGYEYSFCVPASIDDGMDYYRKWCETQLNDNVCRSLFIFASSLYDEPLAKALHPIDEPRKDILIYELEKELPYAYTFYMSYYGASYMIGSYCLKYCPINFHIIAANPYLGGLCDVVNGLSAVTQDMSSGTVNTSYISESPSGGLDDDQGAFLACMKAYESNQDGANLFIPYAGVSNLGVYRFSQTNGQMTIGIDCVDPDSFSHTLFSMNKKMDLALDDFLQRWINGCEIPRHTLYTLESGKVVVDRITKLDFDSQTLETLQEEAIVKEKEYYKNKR